MKDLLTLVLFIGVIGAAFARSSPMSFIEWMRREWRLMRASSWEFTGTDPHVLTRKDERCRRMEIRQRSMGVQLRRDGVYPRVAVSRAAPTDSLRFARRDA